jgi:membrane protease subunit HflK
MKIKRKILISVLVLIYILSGFYTVKPEEISIVRLFGRIVEDRVQPGIHYTLPWPFTQIDRPRIAEIKRMSVGFKIMDQAAGIPSQPEESQMVTGDTNIIKVQMMLQYTIEDPVKYLFRAAKPHFMLRKAAEAELTKIIGSMPVDEVLTTGKIKVQNETRMRTQALMDKYNTGIHIVAANLQSIDPPEEVMNAFKEVSSAKSDKERIINEALSYSNDVVPLARGQAEEILRKADSYKYERINTAIGEAGSFLKVLKEYNKAKDATETRIYIETLEKILPKIKKYLVEGKGGSDTTRFIFSE